METIILRRLSHGKKRKLDFRAAIRYYETIFECLKREGKDG